MFRRSLVVASLALVLGALVPGTGRAQVPQPGRVLEALDVTDRHIGYADGLVAGGGSAPAAQELGIARQLQARARQAYGAAMYALSLRATLDARMHADRAVALVRGLPDPDRVAVQVERTGDLIDRARERLDACADPRARALLRVALEMQGRAELALGESRYLAAAQLTMSARERVLRAARMCRIEESGAEAAARAVGRTDDVLARAREALERAPSPRASALIERALAAQADARAQLEAGHDEAAMRLTQTARVLARRVQQDARRGPEFRER